MNLPLEDIKVIEVGSWGAGPWVSTILAYYGAKVTKIENPAGGDSMRGYVLKFAPYAPYDFCWEFTSCNKRSVAVNLSTERGKEIAHRLIKNADVFVTNVLQPTLKKLNLEYETLAVLNPRLIYAYSTSFGEVGPDADRPGFDYVGWARSGAMNRMGEPNSPPPLDPGGFIDMTAATFTALGILVALHAREITGKGQKVSNSLFGTACWSAANELQSVLATEQDLPRRSRWEEGNPLVNSYQAKDRKWFVLAMVQADICWHDFCQAIGRPDLERDTRFDTHEHRLDNSKQLITILDRIFITKTLAEWEMAFGGKSLIWQRVQSFFEAVHDPQAIANQIFTTFNHPKLGQIRFMTPPAKLSRTPGAFRTAAPSLGEQTHQVLLELGYLRDNITEFRQCGVIG